jgi:alpha-glucosidase
LLTGALPGSLYVYQGDELGLPEVEDLPLDVLQDPMFFRSDGVDPGRDGCRVPLPWTATGSAFGFSPQGTVPAPWLPQPTGWGSYSVERQETDPGSMLSLYRALLSLRPRDPEFSWLDAGQDVLAFRRGADFVCVVNLGSTSVPLPPHTDVLLASSEVRDGHLSPDAAAWLRG